MKSEDKTVTISDSDDAEMKVRPFPGRKADAGDKASDDRHTDRVTDLVTDRAKTHPEVTPQAPAPIAPPPSGAPAPAGTDEAGDRKKGGVRRLILPVIIVAALAGGATYGYDYWTTGRFMISTDDAYLTADIAAVSPKITGYIDTLAMEQNQPVKAGDVLARIDDGDYRIALEQAEAAVVSQRETLKRIQAQTEAARTAVTQAEAQKAAQQAALTNAQLAFDRAKSLTATQYAAQSTLDNARAALDQAKANVAGADAQIASAKANVAVLEAQYNEAQSQIRSLELAVDQAKRNLDLTVLRAPFDGVIGNRSVQKGDLVSPGQKLAAVVPLDHVYIEANFKETQLKDLVPGETVKFTVDAYGDEEFTGTVSSLAPASGAVFSLLPPENATGNFTKVVQRVPVRIDLTSDELKSGRLRAGMSVVVDVDSRTKPADPAR